MRHFRPSLFHSFGRLGCLIAGLAVLLTSARGAAAGPPPLLREFRGVWVATKGNIDWPSEPGLPAAQQQSELRSILDVAVQLRLNAVLLQVRPQADAVFESTLEPWSEVLTGRQGLPPTPRWDPLTYAVREAHQRGLELHAWVNPFRARSDGSRSPLSRTHVVNQHPDWILRYGDQLWLDPGVPAAQAHTLRVISDLVRRYDIDALHMDDYFYPYPLPAREFPDDPSYQEYRRAGGRLERPAWRRANVDGFVQALGALIHHEKPWVKFGISPFGIWRPGHPTGIRGLDAYEVLAADAPRWLKSGWVDYLAPQLYWSIDRKEQSFASLLPWWAQQNSHGRHLWPGLDVTRIGQDRGPGEIVKQLQLVRRQPGAGGAVLWNVTALKANRQGIGTLLRQQVNTMPALVPASPWLGEAAPAVPEMSASIEGKGQKLALKWHAGEGAPVRQFALQFRVGRRWQTEVWSVETQSRVFDRRLRSFPPDEVVLTPVGRTGVAGPPARWRRPAP